MIRNFNITVFSKYAIYCEVCKEAVVDDSVNFAGSDVFGSPEEANDQAKKLGFVAIYTMEDGVLNFCPQCKPNEETNNAN